MAAVGLPITVNTAALVMAAQSAGRIVPIAPASAGIRVALLSYGFVETTDSPVDIGRITGFWLILGATHLIASVAIGLAAICLSFATTSPKRALAIARKAAQTARRDGEDVRKTRPPHPNQRPVSVRLRLRELGAAPLERGMGNGSRAAAVHQADLTLDRSTRAGAPARPRRSAPASVGPWRRSRAPPRAGVTAADHDVGVHLRLPFAQRDVAGQRNQLDLSVQPVLLVLLALTIEVPSVTDSSAPIHSTEQR